MGFIWRGAKMNGFRRYLIGAMWGIISLIGYSYLLEKSNASGIYQLGGAYKFIMFTFFAPAGTSAALLQMLGKILPGSLSLNQYFLLILPPVVGILFFLFFVRLVDTSKY